MFDPNAMVSQREPEEVEVELVENHHVRFFRSLGNWAEFGLYLSAGLLIAFISRLIPGMLIAYGLLMMAIALGGWSMAMGSGSRPAEYLVLGIAVFFSVIGGFWDAAWLLLKAVRVAVEANPFWLIGLGGLGMCVVVLMFWRKR